ncbi:hypothetical protein [Paenibacillus sp. FSL R7-0128]|uniref:hypothetical protein n=1 Tax=Paenibacillus sp. FSL R7-0128 TaxID=2954529 RepID=UPI0030F77668
MRKTADKIEVRSDGVGIFGLLGVLFIALKLTGVIGWSWWWVTLPFWGGFAIGLTIAVCVLMITVVAALASRK